MFSRMDVRCTIPTEYAVCQKRTGLRCSIDMNQSRPGISDCSTQWRECRLIELSPAATREGLWMKNSQKKSQKKRKDAMEASAASGKMSRKDFEKELATLQ